MSVFHCPRSTGSRSFDTVQVAAIISKIRRQLLPSLTLFLLTGCQITSPRTPNNTTAYNFDQMPLYQADVAAYREAAEGNVSAATAAAASGGAPCATEASEKPPTRLVFCTDAKSSQLVVQLQDGDKLASTATNPVSIASTPPGVTGATTVTAASGVATFDQLYLNNPGTYILTARSASLSVASQPFTVAANVERARYFRNKIADRFMGDIDYVYGEYLGWLYTGQASQRWETDALNLGLTTAATISLVAQTKTILSALAAGLAGINLSFDKNFFGQQTYAALAIAMQARRDLARKSITTNKQFGVADYTLEAARRDLISYFYSGTLPGAIQEIQEEAAKKSAEVNKTTASVGTPVNLALTQTEGIAGTPVTVQVQVQDNSGNVVTSATNTVTIASNPKEVTGTASAVLGVATFRLTFKTATTYKLAASAMGLTDATGAIRIAASGTTAGVAANLALTPVDSKVGVPVSVSVQVQDSNGNVVSTFGEQIKITCDPQDVTGTTTKKASAGVATFTLTFASATTYTLTASATNLSGASMTIKAVGAAGLAAPAPVPTPARVPTTQPTNEGLH